MIIHLDGNYSYPELCKMTESRKSESCEERERKISKQNKVSFKTSVVSFFIEASSYIQPITKGAMKTLCEIKSGCTYYMTFDGFHFCLHSHIPTNSYLGERGK